MESITNMFLNLLLVLSKCRCKNVGLNMLNVIKGNIVNNIRRTGKITDYRFSNASKERACNL